VAREIVLVGLSHHTAPVEVREQLAFANGRFEPALWKGVDVVRRLIHAFYDPQFSFPGFAARFPQHRAALIDCLVGDVLKDMSPLTDALAQMTPPPPPLSEAVSDATRAA